MCEDNSFEEFLKYLININYLEVPALGITKQVIEKGMGSLTEKQKHVFQKHVLDDFEGRACKLCGELIKWHEMAVCVFINEDGLCSYHSYHEARDREKFED